MSIVKLRNKIIKGHVLDVLRKLPDECIDMAITSPPYWGLRFYDTTFQIWGGDPDCKHIWESYAQKGQSGGTKSPKVHLRKNKDKDNFQIFEDTNPAFCTECGCYDDQTEILTDNGWKFFKELKEGDEVATLENGYLKFEEPTQYFEYDWNDQMIRFSGNSIDLLVTPSHNMYVAKRDYKYNLRSVKHDFEFIQAKDVKQGYRFKRDFKWNGSTEIWSGFNQPIFVLPVVKDKRNRKKLNQKIFVSMEAWMKFLGIYLAEGCVYYRNRPIKGEEYRVKISQRKKKTKDKIKELLEYHFSFSSAHSVKDAIYIYNKSLYYFLEKLGKHDKKYIPQEFKNLPPDYLKELINGFIMGDGHIRKDGRKEAYTTSKQLADDLQEIGLKAGYYVTISEKVDKRPNRKKIYRMAFLENKKDHFVNHITQENYNGKVYCVEVSNHILLVRRGGKPIWCGNSWYGELGNEPTFNLFVSHLVSIFDEIKRVLKPHGTIWVNLGDSYFGSGKYGHRGKNIGKRSVYGEYLPSNRIVTIGKDYQSKCMCLVPERFAIGMVEAGWILRNKITWYKPNAMPESVKDRLSRKTEEIYLFSKDPKNFFDLDAVRTPLKASTIEREKYTRIPQSGKYFEDIDNPNIQAYLGDKRSLEKGANPGDVFKDSTLTQTNEIITMFSKNKKYFFNLDAVRIKSKTYEEDKRCQDEKKRQYNGKSEKTSRFIKSKEEKNPGNVLLGSITYDDKIKLKKKYDFMIKKLQESNLTEEEKDKVKKDIKKAIKSVIKGEIEKFDLVLRGDKSFGGKEGRVKELQEKGFYILFRYKGKNPGNVEIYEGKYPKKMKESSGYRINVYDKKKTEELKAEAKKLFPDDPKKQYEYMRSKRRHPNGKNPGNVYKDFWKTPQSSIRDPSKKGVLGNLGSEEIAKLKKKVSYYIEKINNCKKMTTLQKRLATKELKQTANLMVDRKIVDFRLWVRGEKSDLGTRGAELDKKGFFIAYVHKTKNPGDIITNLIDIENTYDHPAVKTYSDLIFSLYEELQIILDKGIDIGTFWSINTQSLAEAHFATFPTTLLETPIKAGCPKFVCKSCGKPKEFECGCDVGYRKGIVLDPFMGSGTTGLVARRLGRDYLGIELQEEYIKIALKRISQDKEGRTHKLGSLIKK